MAKSDKIKKSDLKEEVNKFSYIYAIRPSQKHIEKEFGTDTKYNFRKILKIGRSGDSEDRFKSYKLGGKKVGSVPFHKWRDTLIKREDEEKVETELKNAFKKEYKEFNIKKGKIKTEYYEHKKGMIRFFDNIINKYKVDEEEESDTEDSDDDILEFREQIKKLQDENAELKKQLNKPTDETIIELLAHLEKLNKENKLLMQENKVLSDKYEEVRHQLYMYETKSGDHMINLLEIAKYCSIETNISNNTEYYKDKKRIYEPNANSKSSNIITAKYIIDEFKGITHEEYTRQIKQSLDKLIKKHTKLKDVVYVDSRIEGPRFAVDYIYDK